MLFEQHTSHDLLSPSIIDGGAHKLSSSLTSLDFYLLDDIEAYLPAIHSKTDKHDLINDITDDHGQHHDDLFAGIDFSDFDEKSDFVNSIDLDEVDLEQWISQSSFPSPPMDSSTSPLSPIEETTSIASEYADMVVPPSPPLSSAGSSPAPTTIASRKPKLSTVERKLRKKTQNKTAAEKYRIKKKSERHTLLDRHTQLKSVNRDLKLELENLAFRVEKFKQLFVDLLQIDPSTGN